MSARRRRPPGSAAEPLVLFAARIPRSLRQRVRLVCLEQGRRMQEFVAKALREYLDAQLGRRP